MSIFLVLAFLFFIGSMLGWCIEFFYRHFASKDKIWVNPGFLLGPYLPLYGFGLCILYLMALIDINKILLFIMMAILMTIIEYIAGVIFIRGMKVMLWDYSKEKFNFQGIICPKFSFYWALLGAAYYFLIHPHILNALEWLSGNLAFSFVIGLFFGVFFVDFGYSINILSKIRKFAVENNILMKYELLKRQIRANNLERREKIRFLMPFKAEVPFADHLRRYIDLAVAFTDEEVREEASKVINKVKKKAE